MNETEERERRFIKGIYLLPNLFTTSGLFAGFYAIVAAMKGMFTVASLAIFIAMVADSLDGRIARLTHTQSAFGAEYDSISDMVAFGVAPALVAYSLALHHLGKIGWLIAFFYMASTGLRLARFNVLTKKIEPDKRYFKGLPCTASAGFVAGMIWMQQIYQLQGWYVDLFVSVLTIIAAILMVSNVRYRSFKDINWHGSVPFLHVLILVLLFVAIALDPPRVLFAIFSLYLISGPLTIPSRIIKK
ncbi:MAG: CDP-diacylglycerol--serine O-phosphatidyltransferase [Gammaproteobacteria bacterium]|jgi:CDP-diacylglycerol--serine O-phosphatidyltransferase